LTLRIASTTLFGIDAGNDARDVSEAMHELMEIFPYVAGPIGELRRKFGLAKNERFDRARDTLDRIVYGIIARRRKDPSDRGDVLSMLLAATDAETGEAMTDTQVRDEALTLFIAGHETTATALVWTFYLLARHADVDARLASAVRDGDAEFVRRVFQESMRLYPPAWIFAREAMRDVTLSDGRTIAGGTTVFVAPLVLHHTRRSIPIRSGSIRIAGSTTRSAIRFPTFLRRWRAALHRRSVRLGRRRRGRIEDRRSLSARTGLRTRSRARRHGDVAAERARYGAGGTALGAASTGQARTSCGCAACSAKPLIQQRWVREQ